MWEAFCPRGGILELLIGVARDYEKVARSFFDMGKFGSRYDFAFDRTSSRSWKAYPWKTLQEVDVNRISRT